LKARFMCTSPFVATLGNGERSTVAAHVLY
jgi:hypothetical protein